MFRSVLLLASALAVGSLAAATASTGSAPPQPTPGPQSLSSAAPEQCLRFDENGEQVWRGRSTAGLDRLADRVQLLADEHTDITTGVALCSGFEGVAIFVVAGESTLSDEIAAISKDSTYPVLTYPVPVGLDALLAAGDALRVSDVMHNLAGYGPDTYSGRLVLHVAPGSDPDAVAQRARQVLADTPYAAIEIVAKPGVRVEAAVDALRTPVPAPAVRVPQPGR